MVREDLAYYSKRAAEETAAAERADCAKAVEAHRELARFYSDMIERHMPASSDAEPTRLQV